MCGFGMHTIFQFAIFVIVILVLLAILNRAFGNIFTNITGGPYGDIIRLVIGGAIAIAILLFLWRLYDCAGVMHGELTLPLLG